MSTPQTTQLQSLLSILSKQKHVAGEFTDLLRDTRYDCVRGDCGSCPKCGANIYEDYDEEYDRELRMELGL